MLRPESRRTAAVLPLALIGVAALSAQADGAAPGAARLIVETVAVDRRGTWTVASDEADIFPGSDAVLEKSATLIGRQSNAPREMIQASARFAPLLKADGVCTLRLDSEVRRVVSGQAAAKTPVDRKAFAADLGKDEERYIEVYASPVTGVRLGFKVRCLPSAGAVASASRPNADALRFIDFDLEVARGQDAEELSPLKTNRLRAILGKEAGNVFAFNVPLPEGSRGGKRYRREHLEVALTPQVLAAGKIQVRIRLWGDLSTVAADAATVNHPFEKEDTAILASGGVHEVGLDVSAGSPAEGWARVRYRLRITGRF